MKAIINSKRIRRNMGRGRQVAIAEVKDSSTNMASINMEGADEATGVVTQPSLMPLRANGRVQNLLESGTPRRVIDDGWRNRVLQSSPTPLAVVSIGPVTPLILRGSAPTPSGRHWFS